MKTKEIKSFLPVFNGFYETLFQLDTENYLYEEKLDYDDIEIDNEQYEKDVAEACCSWIEDNCEFIKKVVYEAISSPREYNFYNDSINCIIDVDVEAFREYLIENEEALNKYLKDRYTSRDGFWSSYSNSFAEWREETNDFRDLDVDGHRLGALLDFYFDNSFEEDCFTGNTAMDEMCYYVTENIYEGNYITTNLRHIDTIDSHVERKIIARNLLETMEEPFGYMEVLVNEYKQRADALGLDWKTMLADNEFEHIIKESGVEKVELNMLEINY